MAIINSFFYILHGGHLLMQKEVAVKTPEWKFVANATFYRNATF